MKQKVRKQNKARGIPVAKVTAAPKIATPTSWVAAAFGNITITMNMGSSRVQLTANLFMRCCITAQFVPTWRSISIFGAGSAFVEAQCLLYP